MERPEGIGRRLDRAFFQRDTLTVARHLIGKALVRLVGEEWMGGIVVETEAYGGEDDLASHASGGPTTRSTIMYGPAGFAYVYLSYGMHDLLNVVTDVEGIPGAVLIRAVEPKWGMDLMRKRRDREKLQELTSGPGKLTRAMGITRAQNGEDLTIGTWGFWDCHGINIDIVSGPRIGISGSKERPWRFYAAGSPFISKGGVKSETG